MDKPMKPAQIPSSERRQRSVLTKAVHGMPFIRGSLSTREITCGKPGCKCARGEKHTSLYLVVSIDGKYKQIFVPKNWEERVRKWVDSYQRIRDLTELISLRYLEKLVNREP